MIILGFWPNICSRTCRDKTPGWDHLHLLVRLQAFANIRPDEFVGPSLVSFGPYYFGVLWEIPEIYPWQSESSQQTGQIAALPMPKCR